MGCILFVFILILLSAFGSEKKTNSLPIRNKVRIQSHEPSLTEQLASEDFKRFHSTNQEAYEMIPNSQFLNPSIDQKLVLQRMMQDPKTEWEKVLLQHKNAKCLDSSPSGFYIKHGSSPSGTWVIHFGGTSFCLNATDCRNRLNTDYGSSKNWSDHINDPWDLTLLSASDPQKNPYLWDASHVYLPDCSGDAWLGQLREPINNNNNNNNNTNTKNISNPDNWDGLRFSGHATFVETLKHLITKEGLSNAGEIFLGSSSLSSGIGVFSSAQTTRKLLPNALIRGYVINGWLHLSEPYSTDFPVLEHILTKLVRIWDAAIPQSCQNQIGNRVGLCLFGPQLYNYTTVPMFIAQSQYSKIQLSNFYGLPDIVDDDEKDIFEDFRKTFSKTLREELRGIDGDEDGLFSPSCENVLGSRINDFDFEDALGLWCVRDLETTKSRLIDVCTSYLCGICNQNKSETQQEMTDPSFPENFKKPPPGQAEQQNSEFLNPAEDQDVLNYVDRPSSMSAPIPSIKKFNQATLQPSNEIISHPIRPERKN